jgi:phosphatidylglycerol:prolipoprotein diacylglycerol transferase
MHPTLLRLFGLEFHAYPAMLAIAFLTCTLMAVRDLQRRDPPVYGSPNGGLWAFIGALVGAKAYWILQYSEPRYLWQAVFVWEGGLVFYGGLIGGVLGLLAYVRVAKLPPLTIADASAPYLALGEAITRIGCFLNGCCWGRPSSIWWAIRFPRHSHPFEQQVADKLIASSASESLPVHPTQLYMVFGLLAVFVVLRIVGRNGGFAGRTTVLYVLLFGILRFTVESFRGDSARSMAGMTVSQGISLGMVIAAVTVLAAIAAVRRRKTDNAGHSGTDGVLEGSEESPGGAPRQS